VWETAKAGTYITVEQKCDLQLAGSFAARAARDAVELIAASAGANAFRHSSTLTRHLRDLRTITQHAYISTDRYEDVGAIMVGQTQKWPFLFF
jgi:alkylation response protein AidB-like acyl-CoA dehydrogenase